MRPYPCNKFSKGRMIAAGGAGAATKGYDGLEGQTRDFAHKLEDVLEFHELDLNEEVMREAISSFGEAVKKMEKDYIDELSRHNDNDDADADNAVLSSTDFGVEMVGRSRELTMIRERLLKRMRPDDLYYCAIFGEKGCGTTVYPMKIFEDDYALLISQEDEKVSKHLYKLLKNRRYMIVLDDVEDVELVNYLRNESISDEDNGSVIFLTTASEEVFLLADKIYGLEMKPYFFEECFWHVISSIFFRDEPIPTEMEVAGKQILYNCRCLVIPFAKTLMYLLESERTVEVWSKLAAHTQNPIFTVEEEISEIHQIKKEMQVNGNREIILPFIDFPEVGVRTQMQPERFSARMQIISVFGMAGIGKIWNDELVMSHFDHHVGITFGQNYQAEEILLDILAQIYPDIHVKLGDEKLITNLCERLSSKRCLIVFDDLWSKESLLHLRNLFPDIRGTTLVTTRLPKVAKFERDDTAIEMQLLDEEESWSLLCQKVFGGGLCPFDLEKVGHKIAEKCDGLPLLILTVSEELLKVEMSQEYWNNVVSGKEKSVFKNAHHQVSEAVLPSYQSLPQHLKPCFLYMGVFRERCVISTSKLTHLLISEGILEQNLNQMKEDLVGECLSGLLDKSLVMVQHSVSGDQNKSCRLHSVFWHLSHSQAVKNKFFKAMNCYDDCSIESLESQRRLYIGIAFYWA